MTFAQVKLRPWLMTLCLALLLTFVPGAAQALERPLVISSIKPVQLLVTAIAGDSVDSEVLLPPTVSPHHFQLKPSDMRRLREADTVFWVGPLLEQFLAKPLAQLDSAVKLMDVEEGDGLWLGDNHHDHGIDAHIWMSMAELQRMARVIARVLSARMPHRSAYIHSNAARFISELKLLDLTLTSHLLPVREKRYLVLHDAFGRFEEQYGLKHAAVVVETPDRMPGARHTLDLRQRLQSGEFDCVYREPQYQPALLRSLLEGVEIKVIEVDPMAMTEANDPDGFLAFYQRLGEAFAACR